MRKLEEFRAKARELAQSSNFYGWPPLEFELRFEDGYSDAREWLYLPSTRDELDRICQAARKRRDAALDTSFAHTGALMATQIAPQGVEATL